MTTEMILCMDVCHDLEADDWYGHCQLVKRVDGVLDFASAKKMPDTGSDPSFATSREVRAHQKQRAEKLGWKWDRIVAVTA